MPALDAFHRKTTLAEDLRHSVYEQYMEARVRSHTGQHKGDALPSPGVYMIDETGAHLTALMRSAIDVSHTYYVAPHMLALVTAAAETMPDEPVTVGDLPSPQGFLHIPGGMHVIDVRGQILSYTSALWDSRGGKVFVWWFTDKYDETDSTNLTLHRTLSEKAYQQLPQLTVNGETMMTFGNPLGQILTNGKVIPPEVKLTLAVDGNNLVASVPTGYTPDELKEMLKPRLESDPAGKWLVACWRLMQQTIVSLTTQEPPKSFLKAARRHDLPLQPVTVVGLRSAAHRGAEGGQVDWSHRWLVRGHWRNQKCKEDGEWTTRLVWIHPHVKGPEGKPLLIREHVYNLTR